MPTETIVPIIHLPGDGRRVGVLADQSTFKVESAQVNGAYAILEQTIPPGGGPPYHVHRHETEIFYILEGEFELTVGGEKVHAPVGAIAVCPRDIPHTFRNIGAEPARLLLTIIPGRFGDFFREMDPIDPADKPAIRALAAKYDVEILE